jgi:methylated-DNA-protein-cysteine methyltransferase-like protein
MLAEINVMPSEQRFAELVYEYVAVIPFGRVMTYGQIAALCGSPRAARIVGGIAHFGPEELPWHRVVSKSGSLARSFPGGREEQGARLATEGISVSNDFTIDIEKLLWWPQH